MRRLLTLVSLCVCGLTCLLADAKAQQTITIDALDAARAAIATDNDAAAREILDVLLRNSPKATEPQFLMAELEAKEGNLAAAIDRFQKLLADHPDLLRARLDYADALFRDRQDERAEYNFRLALAADLPETVRKNVTSYLYAIRARRKYQLHFEFAMAPDTNINYGTGLSQITLYGLPFTPDPQLRKKSGVGLMASVAGEYRYALTDALSWRTNGLVAATEYPNGSAYNDNSFRAQTGPQWIKGNWDVSGFGVYTQRWFGNATLYYGGGIRVEAAYGGLSRWRLESDVENLTLAFHSQTFQNGNYLAINFYPTYYLSPSSFLRPIVGYVRQDVADPASSNAAFRAGLEFHKEFEYGISANFQGEGFFSVYAAPSPLFGTTRQDKTIRLQVSVYKRDWIIFGFSPVLTFVQTQNLSNQEVYTYNRNQLQVGFTKDF